jgi:hypothetical protein
MSSFIVNTGPNHEWNLKMADAEDSCRSVSVGGMAIDLLGTQPVVMPESASPQGITLPSVVADVLSDQAAERCAEK